MSNRLKELGRFGVSVWLDYISRELLVSGELARLIERDGIRGVTSNPTIFEKAIGSSHEYDEEIRSLAREGLKPAAIFERLAVADIRAAADLFAPLYRETKGQDGFVSLELAPELAHDAPASHKEALRLHALIDRPNLLIKIPGTAAGVRAFEDATADGIPVNVTLLFSQERYAEVAQAYLRGLERRAAHKKDLSRVASVASFFVSRVDGAVDKELAARPKKDAAPLLGKTAIANCKLAYQIYKREFGSPRFAALKRLGARPQRLLWASTSTKNPDYRDVLYVEEIIGPDTVNTMPPATVDAFRDHGTCRPSLEEDAAVARQDLERIASLGVDLAAVTRKLEDEGVASFAKSFETLMGGLAAKKELLLAEEGPAEEGLARLSQARFSSRLWEKDASLWKKEKEHQKIIRNALGWLTVPDAMAAGLGPVRSFADEVHKEGFKSVVVLGMGGSSLCCEVLRTCFMPAPGRPHLEVLDSTNPGAVAALESRLDLKRTLFIVSSKSGSTIEPNCFFEHFFDRVEKAAGAKAGRQFVAITDPRTSLEKLATRRGFRKVFANPPDIGGRYSALSYFGLVPAALMGLDVEKLLSRAREAAKSFSPAAATDQNAALRLGAAMGRRALDGRDKLTLSLSAEIDSFGLWVEQLVAESTGKEGRGIVPVVGEPLAEPASYAPDRLFVRLALAGSSDRGAKERLSALEKAGHPVLWHELKDPYDLGGQFLLWEIATAAAGFLLDVNPFDQPDVQKAKDRAKEILATVKKGSLPAEPAALRAGGLAAQCDRGLSQTLKKGAERAPQIPLPEVLAAHLSRLRRGDYCVLLAYLAPSLENRLLLETVQKQLRRFTTAPVSIEWGPRYLHSTGQLYKGGSNGGVFIQILETGGPKLPIPGQPFDFAVLHEAQARGDREALLALQRRLLSLELGPAGANSLKAISNALEELVQRNYSCPS